VVSDELCPLRVEGRMTNQLSAAFALAITLVVAPAWAPAWAFDTAPHATITEQAMAMVGYNRPAADAVQVENWLTDYYTSSHTFPGDACPLEKLHFDDVFTDSDVDAYWKTLLRNTLAAAVKAKKDNDSIEFYVVLGVSLHVVQDFYAHSNWVEASGFPGPGFDTTTYFQWRQAPHRWAHGDVIHTGWYDNCLHIPAAGHAPHGGYSGPGMNHDSVVRPNYNRAYVYALAASYEWLQQVALAVSKEPGGAAFLTQAMNYQPRPDEGVALARDQDASLYISEWIENPVNLASLDGHWNGDRSGYAGALAAFLVIWTASSDSPYVRAFKETGVPHALSAGLYAPFAGLDPPITPVGLDGTAIDMRTSRVCANWKVGTESYFGRLTIGPGPGRPGGVVAFPIRDAAPYHLPCTDVPWEYLTVLPAGNDSVTMRYRLFNEWGLPAPGASEVPINSGSTEVDFTCVVRPTTGCRWGSPTSSSQPMPGRLDLSGSGFTGVALSGISIQLPTATPWQP
jgi:hypothetical protein